MALSFHSPHGMEEADWCCVSAGDSMHVVHHMDGAKRSGEVVWPAFHELDELGQRIQLTFTSDITISCIAFMFPDLIRLKFVWQHVYFLEITSRLVNVVLIFQMPLKRMGTEMAFVGGFLPQEMAPMRPWPRKISWLRPMSW